MALDKDILFKGNKIYSPENCVFVPECINNLFITSRRSRGEYPIGVNYINSDNSDNKFNSRCRNQLTKETINLGRFNTPLKAFKAYKIYKENYIKEVADYYKNQIPTKLYEAMYSYEVEITD